LAITFHHSLTRNYLTIGHISPQSQWIRRRWRPPPSIDPGCWWVFQWEQGTEKPMTQWIGLREILQENPIFHGKIYGFL